MESDFVPMNDPKAVELVQERRAQRGQAMISYERVPTSSDDCSTLLGMWLVGALIIIQTIAQYV